MFLTDQCFYTIVTSNILYLSDGAYLAVGSHDNFVYTYSVTENGRKYSRVGKCTVSLTEKRLHHFKNLSISSVIN